MEVEVEEMAEEEVEVVVVVVAMTVVIGGWRRCSRHVALSAHYTAP